MYFLEEGFGIITSCMHFLSFDNINHSIVACSKENNSFLVEYWGMTIVPILSFSVFKCKWKEMYRIHNRGKKKSLDLVDLKVVSYELLVSGICGTQLWGSPIENWDNLK